MIVAADATSVYLGSTTGYNIRLTLTLTLTLTLSLSLSLSLSQGEFAVDATAAVEGNTVSATIAGGCAGANTVPSR